MTTERKVILDKASSQELWRLLAEPPADAVEAAYICDCLERQAQAETLKKLDDIARRLHAVETSQSRSSLITPTFWLALLAAGFASFSVPWDKVKVELQRWERQFQQSGQQARRSPQTSTRVERSSYAEPILPQEDPSSPLADALLLLPRTDVHPERFPEL
ncbi:hypothetical protein SAMN02745166_01623 [Prosthecobacter debontii]|uniref:Uncharacterized protein n=1 Tax=Prosthecobacter debontii TaxID=48467 RepID=A0A1T4XJU8_9BACT|nr:hypothetical protein [Prosthecobacter debontii]SKA89839.1 hypothetical protein SAMN02745166_01623 [Prosthecobacter debontii]